jgi:hypothetical protein
MKRRKGKLRFWWPHVLVALVAPACSVSDGVLGRLGDAAAPPDGAGVVGGSCVASPVISLQGHKTCPGRLAANHFSNALCSCGQAQVTYSLTTHGFDSRQGAYQSGQADDSGASVGINGKYSPPNATNVGGSLSIAGSDDMQFLGVLAVRGDFYTAGNLSATGGVTVSRNAWLGGNFSGFGLTVSGDLHHAGTVIALPLLVSGSNLQQAVTVRKPCPCETTDLLDIEALVDGANTSNDNASLGISRDVLASVSGNAEWTVSCGRIYLSQISGIGSLLVHVTGQVALFVEGSIDLKGSLSFDVVPGAEVDIFVKKDFAVQGTASIASKDRPAAGRVWIAGAQAITLVSPWIGNLYAPRARVSSLFALEVWGSIFAGEFFGGASASFTFDRSVTAAEANCSAPKPPAGVCRLCEWCSGGAACVSGSCGPCKKDEDCCSLSVCSNGSCVPWLDFQGSS